MVWLFVKESEKYGGWVGVALSVLLSSVFTSVCLSVCQRLVGMHHLLPFALLHVLIARTLGPGIPHSDHLG